MSPTSKSRKKKRSAGKKIKRSVRRRAENNPFWVVGIGASAGGFEAFKTLLKHIPAKTGMAFVLVQHLDPSHESSLTKLLSSSTTVPVVEAEDGRRVEPDCIYVMPSNVTMTFEDGSLHLSPRRASAGLQHPIDLFFQSMARSAGANAIGVVLSGGGADGTEGLKAIKSEGGITFSQDEQSATFPDMPRSARKAGAVDFVLSPERIAAEIAKISRRRPSISFKEGFNSVDDDSTSQINQLLLDSTGVNFSGYKASSIKRRVARRMMVTRTFETREYLEYLRSNPEEVKALYEDIFIHVTNFFRDPEKYHALNSDVFPKLLSKHEPGRKFRIWVPGCSSGEEVYSIAIALLEFLESRKKTLDIQIFGTDISEASINKARSALYPRSIEEHVSDQRIKRFFERKDNGYQVKKSIRDLCIFAQHDMLNHPPFSRMDIISCCNVLIYFEPDRQKKLFSIFHYALNPSGVLLLGKSESPTTFSHLFKPLSKKYKIYLKRLNPTMRVQLPYFERYEPSAALSHEIPVPPPNTFDLRNAVDKAALSQYGHCGLLIDENMKILQFRGPVSRFLEPSSDEAALELTKMVRRDLLSDLRVLINTAKKRTKSIRKENVTVRLESGLARINLEVAPIRDHSSNQYVFLITFIDTTLPAESFHPVAASRKNSKGDKERLIAQLEKRLKQTTESTQNSIEELARVNEELISTNEELQSANEELQSTNEEYETAKEELESNNEELITLNDQLQQRNAEVDQVNAQLKRARDYAHAIIRTGRQPFVVLDQQMRIITANSAFYGVFQLPQDEVKDHSFFEISGKLWEVRSLLEAVKDAMAKDVPFEDLEIEAEFPRIGARRFVLNGRRVLQEEGEDSLVLLAFEDITYRTTRLKEIHHRVKNNLQVIVSLLRLQSTSIQDPQALAAFRDSELRIQSMAMIHEKLYLSRDADKISFEEYVADLAAHVFQTYKGDRARIDLKTKLENVQLPIEVAIPCGLIITELLSNSLKHGFPDGNGGHVVVELKRLSQKGKTNGLNGFTHVLRVKDNGVGLPEDVDPKTAHSLGMQIITSLTHQLKGDLQVVRKNGTAFRILLPG